MEHIKIVQNCIVLLYFVLTPLNVQIKYCWHIYSCVHWMHVVWGNKCKQTRWDMGAHKQASASSIPDFLTFGSNSWELLYPVQPTTDEYLCWKFLSTHPSIANYTGCDSPGMSHCILAPWATGFVTALQSGLTCPNFPLCGCWMLCV